MTNRDNRSSFNHWRPTELAALIIGLIIFWPLGLAVLVWKYWNDRSSSPRNLDEAVGEGLRNLRAGLASIFGSDRQPAAAPAQEFADDLAPTGNIAFDTHVRDELQRIDAQRRRLADEVRAFRAFLDEERTGGPEVYERFRRRYEAGNRQAP
ncbi:DUF2852 domain-containing protein [Pseudochelatococcus sp. B33]